MTIRFSLSHKLFLYFILLGIVMIAVISGFAFEQAKTALLQRTFDQLTSVRVTRQRQLERFFRDREQDLALLSQSKIIRNLALKLSAVTAENAESVIQEPFLISILPRRDYLDGLLISYPNGRLIEIKVNSGNTVCRVLKNPPRIIQQKRSEIRTNETYFFPDYIQIHDGESPALWLGRYLYHSAIERTLVILKIPVHAVNHVILDKADYRGLGETGETYAVGPDYLMRSSSRFTGYGLLNTPVFSHVVDSALAGVEGTGIITDYRGVLVLCSYGRATIGNTNWAILAEIDWNEAFYPVETFRRYLIYLSLILLGVLLVTAFAMARRITRPILRLREAVNRLRQGVYPEPVEVQSQDELGELTAGFNKMALQLKTQTEILKEREQRLRHFYNATLDGILFHHGQRIVLVNHAVTRMTGFSYESLIGKPVQEIISLITREPGNESGFFESQARRRDGSAFPVEIQNHPIEYNGTMMEVAVIRDITRRKQTEKALRQERVKRISSVIDGQEQERRRVARELHDGLGQSLVAIKLRLENAMNSPNEKIMRIVSDTLALCDTTIDEVRRISDDLMPAVMYELGFLTAIKNLCSELSKPGTLSIRCQINLADKALDERTQMYLFRIAQEALTNIVRHSRATEAELLLEENRNQIRLVVSDNGCGFDARRHAKIQSRGLHNIRTRVNLLNGTLNIGTSSENGAIIDVLIPRENGADGTNQVKNHS